MENTKKVLELLQTKQANSQDQDFTYILPNMYNFFGYSKAKDIGNNEINVNPYDFYVEALLALVKNKPEKKYLLPLSMLNKHTSKNGNWIKKAFVYSSMIRTSSSYDHNKDGKIELSNPQQFRESGTFLKQILLIPYLKEMGINTLYLLPFFKNSQKFKKGEFGSCYAIKDFFSLDDMLSDPLLDPLPIFEQAKAFFEICHMHDIRVVMDIIPRTSAIDSTLIKDHPEWFYWIDKSTSEQYKPPIYDNIPTLVPPTRKNMQLVYKNPATKEFLRHFRFDPKTTDKTTYSKILKRCEIEGADFLEEVEKAYGIIVACAFSDWINDPQPVWSDVTYLRMFLDNNALAATHVEEDHPPYILFDSTKANLYPSQSINTELWDVLIQIIPFYQREFGIDGVRIDMGHALPTQLIDLIIKKAKEIDPDVCFIAEELDTKNARKSYKKGYNMILGNGFSEESRIHEGQLHQFYYGAKQLACPVFALCESHDTSRVSAKPGKKNLNKMLTILNLFMPNGVAFLNSGQELYEVQPMNLGLDCPEEERYNLDKNDPRYNKLALFDPFYFTYNAYDPSLRNILIDLKELRQKYIQAIISKKRNLHAVFHGDSAQALGSYFVKNHSVLLVVANADLTNTSAFTSNLHTLQSEIKFPIKQMRELLSTSIQSIPPVLADQKVFLSMSPLEVKIIEFS